MAKDINLKLLLYYFNSIIDKGGKLSIEETENCIENGCLFTKLKEKFPDTNNLSWISDDISKYERYFKELHELVNSERKFNVKNEGLCLLIAYCVEGLSDKTLK